LQQEQLKQNQIKPLQQQDHALETTLATRYAQIMMKLTYSYMQRAKNQWAKGGDRNTSFFHHGIVKRMRRNSIVSIKVFCNSGQIRSAILSQIF
jgi:hypothetical protein